MSSSERFQIKESPYAGAIDQPEAGTYTLTYGEAVDLGYCRPVTFHRHEGKFTVDEVQIVASGRLSMLGASQGQLYSARRIFL
jgi:hypothetical protein